MPDVLIYGPDGFPIVSTAELAETVSNLSLREAEEALYLIEDRMASRNGMFADEDREWAGLHLGANDPSRDAVDFDQVQRAAELAYKYWVHNPIIHQGVEVTSEYVFGQGISVTAEEEGLRTQARELWEEPDMQMIAGGRGLQRLCSKQQVYGNLFLALFPRPAEDNRIRVIEMSSISRVQVDEWGTPMLWLRSRIDPSNPGNPIQEWVPSIDHWEERSMLSSPDNKPVRRDFAVQHITQGSLVGALGLPTFWSGLPWAKAYKGSLEDFSVVQRALRTFAWRATGSSFDGVSNARSAVQDAFQRASSDANAMGRVMSLPTNDSSFQPIRTANYQTPAEGSRRLLLMACAAFGLPETYFGDVSVGTYATAQTMERPVELRMRSFQQLWGSELERMISFLLDGDTSNEKGVNVVFPSLVEHDAGPYMQAVKVADSLTYPVLPNETMAALTLQALGVDDVEDQLEQLEQEGMFDKSRAEMAMDMQVEQAKQMPQPEIGQGGTSGPGRPPPQNAQGGDRQRPDRPTGRGLNRPQRR